MLKQQAQKILNQLKNSGTPSEGLSLYTVGDAFRSNLLELESEILSLTGQPRILMKVVKGSFGSGKSHFLEYLGWMLRYDCPSNCIISKISLDKLRDPDDFQLLLVKGMRTISEDKDYLQILVRAFHDSRNFYIQKNLRNIYLNPEETKKLYALIIYQLLGMVSQNILSSEIIQLLDTSQHIPNIANSLTKFRVKQLLEKARNQSSTENIEFVETYLNIIDDPDAFASDFEAAAKKLSREGTLTDVIFRILKISGFKTIVILLDEMESLKTHNIKVKQTLTNVRAFIDGLRAVGEKFGYPSTAFICASTDEFFSDTIRENEPPLYSRLEDQGQEIVLQNFSPADIDNLIFKLRELFFLAGEKLPHVRQVTDSVEHDAIAIRQKILTKFSNSPSDLTCRKLVREILKEISLSKI